MNPAPRPLDGEVHLHYLTLPQETSELTRFERLLSMSEADRAGQLKSAGPVIEVQGWNRISQQAAK